MIYETPAELAKRSDPSPAGKTYWDRFAAYGEELKAGAACHRFVTIRAKHRAQSLEFMTNAIQIRHLPFGRAAVLNLDKPLVVHAHSRQHLLVHLGGAASQFGVSRRVLPLTAEHAVFVDSWQPHWYPHATSESPSRILALYLDPGWFAAHGASLRFATTDNALRLGPGAPKAIGLFLQELREDDDGRSGVLEWALLELMAALEPCSAVARSPGIVSATAAPAPLDRRIEKTLRYMQEHVGERLEFGRIAGAAGLSRPHFFELFQRDLGLTPNVYWNALRMESAIAQLASRDASVASVSASLGFSAQSNFTRFFRDIQGVAPAEYRSARIQTLS